MPSRRLALVPVLAAAALAAGVLAPQAAAPAQAATATAASATSYTPTAADRRIASKLAARMTTTTFGRYASGTVLDVASNRVVWSKNGTVGRMPASTTKLVTATNALTVYGPAYRFTTKVVRPAWWGVYLVGSGDPSLSGANLSTLADQTAAAVKASGHDRVRVYVDDYLFPKPVLPSGWKASYIPTDVRWVRALVVDGHHVYDTSMDAGAVFAAKLKARGITVTQVARHQAPKAAPVVATVQGQRLDQMIAYMLQVSDNDHAEALNRLVALRKGYPATWTSSRVAQRLVLGGEGIWLSSTQLKDGSGLSRNDRLTTLQLAQVVDNAFEPAQTDLAVLRSGGLPVAGRTGTLAHRFVTAQSTCARGKVSAKTGTLHDAVALAGFTRGTDGRLKAFAFVVNYKLATTTLQRNVDMLAATVTGCY